MQWPPIPDEKGCVLSLMELAARAPHLLEHIMVLVDGAQSDYGDADHLRFQVVVESRSGKVCLPCVVTKGDGKEFILHSHYGTWTKEAVRDLRRWVVQVRSCIQLERTEMRIYHTEKPPVDVDELISTEPVNLLAILALPYLDVKKPEANALVARQALRYLYGYELSHEPAEALRMIDAWRDSHVTAVLGNTWLMSTLMIMFGSVLGETVRMKMGGEWSRADENAPANTVLKIDECSLNVFGRAARWLQGGTGTSLLGFLNGALAMRSGGESSRWAGGA